MASIMAFCVFAGALKGRINFQELGNKSVLLTGNINGLSPGMHGFHVHEHGNLSNNCMAAGDHFNPALLQHGGPHDAVRHAGDFGNIESNSKKNAHVYIIDSGISLDPANQFSILNRTLVVHDKPDDLGKGGNPESLKTGNAGARVDCCLITRSQMRSSGIHSQPQTWCIFAFMIFVSRLIM